MANLEIINNDKVFINNLKNQISSQDNLVGIATIKVHVQETYKKSENGLICIESKLLSKNDLDNINKEHSIESSSTDDPDPITKSKHELTMRFAVFNGIENTTGIKYVLSGVANWSPGYFAKYGPAPGMDYMGYYWGGGFDYSDHGIVIEPYDSGDSFEGDLVDATPNAGLVWGFNERNNKGNYAKRITIGSTLTKNTPTGSGNTTSVVLKYIHTYQSYEGTVSLNVSPSPNGPISGSFTLMEVEKQWPLVITISGLEF